MRLGTFALSFAFSLLLSTSIAKAETQPETQSVAETSAEPSPSYDVIIGGQNTNVTLGINGNFPVYGLLNASLGLATTSIGPANLLDIKAGVGTLEPKMGPTTIWSHLFIGQTQIETKEPLGLDKGDSRYWFFEGFIGLGFIGVGYRFNFMKDGDGIYIRKTHIARNQMFPFIAISSRQ